MSEKAKFLVPAGLLPVRLCRGLRDSRRIGAKRRQWFPLLTGATVGASPSLKPANPQIAGTKIVGTKIAETTPPGTKAARPKPKLGLRAWMERVLVECDRAAAGFEADPVHDLRVALRRCRSLADGLMALDPDSSWKDMKKAGKKLFQALGELRDVQVMQEWVEKLSDGNDPGASNDPVAVKLLDHVHVREAVCKQLALKDLNQFDRKQWRQWASALPRRAARVRPGSVVDLHLAL